MKFHFRHYDHHHHGGGGIVLPADHPSALLVVDPHGQSRSRSGDFRSAELCGEEQASALDASRHHGECIEGHPSPEYHSLTAEVYQRAGSPARRHSAAPVESSCPGSPSENVSGWVASTSPADAPSASGLPTSKRALHLEQYDCPVSNPEPHSRPRSRQFFRLGRHRRRGIDKTLDASFASDTSSDDEPHVAGERATVAATAARRRSRGIAGLRKPMLRRAHSLPLQTSGAVVTPTEPTSFATERGSQPGVTSTSSADETNPAPLGDRLSASEPCRRGHRRHVTFACVQIREYSTILGDHPCCPSGPPLSLGWELERENAMDFEAYEKAREPIRVKSKEDLRLDSEARRDILQSLVVAAPTTASEASCKSDSDDDHHDEKATTARYSQRELNRAERRLQRDRSGMNAKAHQRRIKRGFFQPLTPEESQIAGAPASEDKEIEPLSPMKEEAQGSVAMDISPMKPEAI